MTGGGSGAGAGGGGIAIGLAGFTGLVTFVGFVIDFTHVFVVSSQSPKAGWPYGSGQLELCWRVIPPV